MLLFDAVELEYPRSTDVLLFAPQANVLFWGPLAGVALRFSNSKKRESHVCVPRAQQRRFCAKTGPKAQVQNEIASVLRSLAGSLPKISQRRLSCIPDDSEVARSLVERTTQCGAEQEALHATAATKPKADVGPTTAITSRTPPLRADGAHILPDKGLSERQRAALVPKKPAVVRST